MEDRDATGYLPYLDGLRALAVAGVVAGHAGVRFPGYQGVTVFFVISGFLITGLLRRERSRTGRIDLVAFYRRRFARLAPAFVVVLAVTSVWLLATGTAVGVVAREVAYAATYTTDVALAVDPAASTTGLLEWSWSLAVEEQFYLVWPLVLLLVATRRVPDRWLLGVCGVLVAAVWVDRAVLAAGIPSHARLFYAPDTHADALVLGAALAVLVTMPALRRRWLARTLLTAALLGFALALVPGALTVVRFDAGSYGTVALLAAALLLGLALQPGGRAARVLGARPLAHLGRLSYGLYLWNLLTIVVFEAITGLRPTATPWGWLWLAALLVVVEASYRLVETPARQRLAGRRAPDPPVPAATAEEPEPSPAR